MDEDDLMRNLESPGIEGKDYRIHRLISFISIFVLLVLACNLPYLTASVPTPTQPDFFHTAVALTLTAQLTQAAAPSQSPGQTPLPPTQTLEPTDTAEPPATPTRTNTPSPTLTLSPLPPFAVTGLTANVTPLTYTGPCPVDYTWSATITVNGPGIVTFQWEMEGGAPDAVQDLTFSDSGSQTITKHTSTSSGHANTTVKVALRILTPNEIVSSQAVATQTCQPDIYLEPDSVDFGEVDCHSSGSLYAIIIEHLGIGRLDISSVNITSGGSFFSIADDACTGKRLFREEQCPMAIRFGPLGICGPSGTNYGGNLRIGSNDPDEATVNVDLSARQE